MIINVLYIILLLQASRKVVCKSIYHKNVPSFVKMLLLSSGHCREKIELTFDTNNNNDTHSYMKSRQYRSNLMEAAVCFHSLGRFKEAQELYYYIREQFPEFAFPLVNIALIELVNGKSQQVIDTLDVYFQEVGGMYGNATKQIELKDSNAKIFGPHCLPKALYHLECVSALNFYGIAQVEKYNYETAMKSYRQAIALGNDDVYFISDVHQNLGSLFKTIGLEDDAADSFLRSFWSSMIVRKIVNPAPLLERAMLVPSISASLEESLKFKMLFEKRIKDLIKLIDYGGTGWVDDSDLFKVRDDVSNLDNIKALSPLTGTYNYMYKKVQNTHFYLHYYGYHDKPLQELVMSMYERIRHPSLTNLSLLRDSYQVSNLISTDASPYIPGHIPGGNPTTRQQGSKMRIVFISSHFGGNEPHGLLLIDVIKRLPSNIFECIAIIIGTNQPSQTFVDAVEGMYHSVGSNDSRVRELLVELTPDCLVFGEVMNDGMLFSLAQLRFAPLQVLVMGAPVTSGFSTIDYFISGDRLEHPFRTQMSGDKSDKEHYTEQVVLFDGQAISFPFDESHPFQSAKLAKGDAKESINAASSVCSEETSNDHNMSRYCNSYDQSTGLPIDNNGGSLYLCFQNLFKIHPILDNVFMKILQLDRNGHIILQASRDLDKTVKVIHRIQQTVIEKLCHQYPLVENRGKSTANAMTHSSCDEAEQVLSRMHFIPRVTSHMLEEIYSKVDVILHPFPFSGSKTASDAFKFGKPLVTFPQPYLRGRLASTFYSTMALHELHPSLLSSICCEADSMLDYITKAVNLGQNKTYNKLVSNGIEQRKHRIYNDEQTSFEWSRFLCRALGVTHLFNMEEGEDKVGKKSSTSESENNVVDKFLMREMEYMPKKWQEDWFVQDEMIQIQKRWRISKMEEAALLF